MPTNLLTVIAGCVVPLGLVYAQMQEDFLPASVISQLKAVRRHGFTVYVNREDGNSERSFWLHVFNERKQATDEALAEAAKLPNVAYISMTNPDSDGAALSAFQTTRSLEYFRLSIDRGQPISKSFGIPGWKSLGLLTQLKTLEIDVPVTIDQFENLTSLRKLETVRLAQLPEVVEPVLKDGSPAESVGEH